MCLKAQMHAFPREISSCLSLVTSGHLFLCAAPYIDILCYHIQLIGSTTNLLKYVTRLTQVIFLLPHASFSCFCHPYFPLRCVSASLCITLSTHPLFFSVVDKPVPEPKPSKPAAPLVPPKKPVPLPGKSRVGIIPPKRPEKPLGPSPNLKWVWICARHKLLILVVFPVC